jgi:hypothetical protein
VEKPRWRSPLKNGGKVMKFVSSSTMNWQLSSQLRGGGIINHLVTLGRPWTPICMFHASA